jgi:hypothetical protein
MTLVIGKTRLGLFRARCNAKQAHGVMHGCEHGAH